MENKATYNAHLHHTPTRPDWQLDDMQLQFDQLIRMGMHIQQALIEHGRLKSKRIFSRAEVRKIGAIDH